MVKKVTDNEYTKMEVKALKSIKDMNLSDKELNTFLKQVAKPKIQLHNTHHRTYRTKKTRIGIISDLHIGHKKFDENVFYDSIKQFKKDKVDVIYCPGDIIEGMSGREGHIYELDILGISCQVNKAVDLLNEMTSNVDAPLEFILGNHDLWAMKKGNQGYNIGKDIERRVKNSIYLGDLNVDIMLNDKLKVNLSHEGSSAYALSYSMQKRINALSGGDKPQIKLNGHIHKILYMFYRNIHAVECGTLQRQTEFMAMKGSPSHVGFVELDIHHSKKGELRQVVPKLFPYY